MDHQHCSYSRYFEYLGRQSQILAVLGVRKTLDTPSILGVSSILGASVQGYTLQHQSDKKEIIMVKSSYTADFIPVNRCQQQKRDARQKSGDDKSQSPASDNIETALNRAHAQKKHDQNCSHPCQPTKISHNSPTRTTDACSPDGEAAKPRVPARHSTRTQRGATKLAPRVGK